MRQREQIEQSWEVVYAPRPDSGTHRLWSRHESSAEAHSAARRARAGLGASVRVHRVTRYRLAPLVEIGQWERRHGYEGGPREEIRFSYPLPTGTIGAGTASVGPSGFGDGTYWWRVLTIGATLQNNRVQTRGVALLEAEAALAWLGYRVAR
jgi:hypothetical protein